MHLRLTVKSLFNLGLIAENGATPIHSYPYRMSFFDQFVVRPSCSGFFCYEFEKLFGQAFVGVGQGLFRDAGVIPTD